MSTQTCKILYVHNLTFTPFHYVSFQSISMQRPMGDNAIYRGSYTSAYVLLN